MTDVVALRGYHTIYPNELYARSRSSDTSHPLTEIVNFERRTLLSEASLINHIVTAAQVIESSPPTADPDPVGVPLIPASTASPHMLTLNMLARMRRATVSAIASQQQDTIRHLRNRLAMLDDRQRKHDIPAVMVQYARVQSGSYDLSQELDRSSFFNLQLDLKDPHNIMASRGYCWVVDLERSASGGMIQQPRIISGARLRTGLATTLTPDDEAEFTSVWQDIYASLASSDRVELLPDTTVDLTDMLLTMTLGRAIRTAGYSLGAE